MWRDGRNGAVVEGVSKLRVIFVYTSLCCICFSLHVTAVECIMVFPGYPELHRFLSPPPPPSPTKCHRSHVQLDKTASLKISVRDSLAVSLFARLHEGPWAVGASSGSFPNVHATSKHGKTGIDIGAQMACRFSRWCRHAI